MKLSYVCFGMTNLEPLHCSAAGAKAIGGTQHLVLAKDTLGFNINTCPSFLICRTVQTLWILSTIMVIMVKRGEKPLHSASIIGTPFIARACIITHICACSIKRTGGANNDDHDICTSGKRRKSTNAEVIAIVFVRPGTLAMLFETLVLARKLGRMEEEIVI
jgi:hypothetical protein